MRNAERMKGNNKIRRLCNRENVGKGWDRKSGKEGNRV